MIKTTYLQLLLLSFCFFVISMLQNANAQIVIGTPNLGFTQACASQSFNTYSTTFIFSLETGLYPSNKFSIEMSDAEGDFTNSTIIYNSSPGAVTVSPATLDFSLPETTAGENYRIKIKSSAPVSSSSASVPFAAYFKVQDAPFSINHLVSTGAFCTGGSYLLTIDNPGTSNNDSPLLYPNLTYKWFKETSATTSEFVANGETLAVTAVGTYFVKTNYGTCTSDSFSNRVTISEVSTGDANASIISSLGNPFCPEQGTTTLTTIGGNSYQWYKDGDLITEATNQMYQTNQTGIYSVQVDLGDCAASGSIDLVSEIFESSIDVPEINEILAGYSLNITMTSNAQNPEYSWYMNDDLIPNETGPSFEAMEFGDYKAVIIETIGCIVTIEHPFIIQEASNFFPDVDEIPNMISPNGDGINDTWIIPQIYHINDTNTEVFIMNDHGKVIVKTNTYQNNWPETDLNLTSVNQVYYYVITTEDGKTKKGSITVVK